MDITFLTVGDVLHIHRDQVSRYGGTGGLRDIGLLEAAVAAPAAGTREGYLHDTIASMAGAYLFHTVRNHPFVDGNKRTGVVAALVFLDMNCVEFGADEAELERLVFAVAEGSAGGDDASAFFARAIA